MHHKSLKGNVQISKKKLLNTICVIDFLNKICVIDKFSIEKWAERRVIKENTKATLIGREKIYY